EEINHIINSFYGERSNMIRAGLILGIISGFAEGAVISIAIVVYNMWRSFEIDHGRLKIEY
ncbi:MAG: hypothetical protein AAF933_16550, partial [Pseudomonadota bacterium]